MGCVSKVGLALVLAGLSMAATAAVPVDSVVEVVLLDKQAGSDRELRFQEVAGGQCQYSALVESGVIAVINHKVCADGLTTAVNMVVPLGSGPIAEGQKRFLAYQDGPVPLAIIFMTQFYEVPVTAVQVEVVKQNPAAATVRAVARGHACTFDAAPLTSGKARWGASSMQCEAVSE